MKRFFTAIFAAACLALSAADAKYNYSCGIFRFESTGDFRVSVDWARSNAEHLTDFGYRVDGRDVSMNDWSGEGVAEITEEMLNRPISLYVKDSASGVISSDRSLNWDNRLAFCETGKDTFAFSDANRGCDILVGCTNPGKAATNGQPLPGLTATIMAGMATYAAGRRLKKEYGGKKA